jgi:hypothetical protein
MQSEELLKRWRLILGGEEAEGTGINLSGTELEIDNTLAALYDSGSKTGLGKTSPNVNRWLGDIRTYFPSSVVKVMQQDALKRLNLKSMLLEPETLASLQPDVHLIATLLTLSKVIPDKTRDTARKVVQTVVDELMQKLSQPTMQAIIGSLNKATRTRRPKFNEMDWHTTIRKNLKHYQPEHKTIIPEVRYGYGRKRSALKDIVLCLDQSGSMASSVVYSGIFGAVMASIPAVRTHMVAYDDSFVDLTKELKDPVDLLFGVQLGGGNDTARALIYCQQLITRPNDTILVLITDLYEGAGETAMRKEMTKIVESGAQLVVLLALNDDGTSSYDHANAAFLASLGIPVFACTPDKFPDLMACAIQKQSISQWAATQGIPLAGK